MNQAQELFDLLLRALACIQKQHAGTLKRTMWGIVVRHVGDNGERTARVGS